jgi:glycerol-3-phosphate dehydrogenase (NAD(P)+)
MEQKIAVLGAGSWGTALALTLSGKGHLVHIWDIDKNHTDALNKERENTKYLPGIKFNESIQITDTVEEAIKGADIVLFSAPAQHFRSALSMAQPYLTHGMVMVNVAKGIEQNSLKRLSEIAFEDLPDVKYVALSGPSHAEEVGKGMPTTVVAASSNVSVAEYVQEVFMTERFRVYTNTDVAGVEFGGALKNTIALGAGISDGMGFGDNAKAALMTRGITEIARLGVRLGAKAETFTGLTGIGDLIVTCTSMHSRNRRCGIMIGEGMNPKEATQKVGMVVEGMYTTQAAYDLARKWDVEMPITEKIYEVINEKTDAKSAVTTLMTRQKKHEIEDCFNGRYSTCRMPEG